MSRSDKTKTSGIADDRAANEDGADKIHSETDCCVGNTCCWENTSKRSVEETEG